MSRLKSFAVSLGVILFALLVVLGCSEDEPAVGPSDTTPPTITGHYPADGATDVSRSGPYWIAFSEPMDEEMVEDLLGFDLDPWQYNLSWNGDTLIITPYSLLDAGTTYTITIDGYSEDLAGNKLGSDFSFSFTTTTQADNTPPTVTSTIPAGGATGVSPGATIMITFSEPMNLTTTSNAIEFDPAPADYGIDWEGVTMMIDHFPFPQNTTVTVTVTTAATDLAGNHLVADYSFQFHTLVDNISPYLESANPANGETNVQTTLSQVVLNFSEPMFPMFEILPEDIDAKIIHDLEGDDAYWNDDYSTVTVPVRSGIDLLRGCTYWIRFRDVTDMAGNPIDPNPTPYEFTTSGTPVYFLYESGDVQMRNTYTSEIGERRVENYNPSGGTFDIVFEDFGGVHDIWHMKKTGTEIQHLGRDEYDEGSYDFTMMWDEPLPFLKLPLQSHIGETWYFSTGATLDPNHAMTLDGSVEIEDYPVNLVSEELNGTFRGCYVHHLNITVIFYEYGVPADTNTIHDKTWLAEGVGWVRQVSEESEGDTDTLVVVDWDI